MTGTTTDRERLHTATVRRAERATGASDRPAGAA